MHVVTHVQQTHIGLANNFISKLEGLEDWETNIEETKRENIIAFCKLTIKRILNGELPDDKMGRWLGFVQGTLTTLGIIDVNEERNRTRPLFHKAYTNAGILIPETKEI